MQHTPLTWHVVVLLLTCRCSQIMGRSESDDMSAAQIMYPCMQCADIFFLKADICQLGLDQRKVNMLAREYCDDIKRKFKPVILSHRMMPGVWLGSLGLYWTRVHTQAVTHLAGSMVLMWLLRIRHTVWVCCETCISAALRGFQMNCLYLYSSALWPMHTFLTPPSPPPTPTPNEQVYWRVRRR